MILTNHRNSKAQGTAGLGAAIAWFTSRDIIVCLPLNDSQPFDLVVEWENRLQRVQVKTATYKDDEGHFVVELRSKGGNRSGTGKTKQIDPSEVDLLFVHTDDINYLMPLASIKPRSGLVLSKMYDTWIV